MGGKKGKERGERGRRRGRTAKISSDQFCVLNSEFLLVLHDLSFFHTMYFDHGFVSPSTSLVFPTHFLT